MMPLTPLMLLLRDQPPERLHSRKHFPGSGIGLTLCKQVVDMHGGHIWIDSAPGLGTTVTFTLPAAR